MTTAVLFFSLILSQIILIAPVCISGIELTHLFFLTRTGYCFHSGPMYLYERPVFHQCSPNPRLQRNIEIAAELQWVLLDLIKMSMMKRT